MRAIRLIPILVLVVAILIYQHHASVSPDLGPRVSSSEVDATGYVPKKAYQVLEIVKQTGQAPEGYVGGRVFQNREHRLPADGDYREFDVDPHDGNRNAERIIIEWDTKKAWYTGDHYQTFIPML
jgi:guanyl-specific ribonuclease Sa